MAQYISPEKRAKILSSIMNDGVGIDDAAKTHGVTEKTIRKWIRSQAKNAHTSSNEIEKLKKENLALKELIGEMMLERRLKRKNNLFGS